jgi:hypothetical protein
MYYCVVCSKIHHRRAVEGDIFENGFYIDPFLVKKIHLGMCGEKDNMGNKKGKIIESPKLVRIIDEKPIHHDKRKIETLL